MNTAIDLSQIPAPQAVESLAYEAICAAMLKNLQERDPVFTALNESDPAYKILEVAAYRELLLRQRINDAARAVMLAYAGGENLDNLAALFGVVRKIIDPGDPEAIPLIKPTYEDDVSLRYRSQLALEGFSVAGSAGAYEFHALSADSRVKDVSISNPNAGEVLVTVLSTEGDGTADQNLLDALATALNAEDIRPLCDTVIVQGAEILNYTVAATLELYDGPDAEVVLATAKATLIKYVMEHHRLGDDITHSGLYAALHVGGVKKVTLVSPVADILCASTQAAYADPTTDISVTIGGNDE